MLLAFKTVRIILEELGHPDIASLDVFLETFQNLRSLDLCQVHPLLSSLPEEIGNLTS